MLIRPVRSISAWLEYGRPHKTVQISFKIATFIVCARIQYVTHVEGYKSIIWFLFWFAPNKALRFSLPKYPLGTIRGIQCEQVVAF